MTIKTIERSASREYRISLDLKEWKGARMVAEISETEDEYECGKELGRKVERQLADNHNPEIIFYEEGKAYPVVNPTPLPSIDYKAIERLEILIDNAVTLEELDNLRVEVQKYSKDRPGLAEVFNKRLIEISPFGVELQQNQP